MTPRSGCLENYGDLQGYPLNCHHHPNTYHKAPFPVPSLPTQPGPNIPGPINSYDSWSAFYVLSLTLSILPALLQLILTPDL